MDKDAFVNLDGTEGKATLRVSGSPKEGGNSNNFAAASVTNNQRVELQGGAGVSGSMQLDSGVTLIGSAGVTGKAAANFGISAEKSQAHHDTRRDTPLGPRDMGIFEIRDAANEIKAQTKGTEDLGKLSISQVMADLKKHPNILTEKSDRNFERDVHKLEGIKYTPPAEIAEAQAAIAKLNERWLAQGAPQINFTGIDGALAKYDVKLSDNAKLVAQELLTQAGGSIPKLNAAAQHIPEALLKTQSAADLAMPLTLSQIDNAAIRTRDFLAKNGGASGFGNNEIAPVNALLAAVGQPAVSNGALRDVQNFAGKVDAEAAKAINEYNKLPSPEKVAHWTRMANELVKYDPAAEISAFIAGGALTKPVNLAAVAEKTASVGIGNLRYTAGEGVHVNPAITDSLRLEAGKGTDASVSFSTDTARKLNLPFASSGTQMGGYAFVERDRTHWMRIDGSESSTSIGAGVTVTKALGGDKVAYVAAEAATNIGPGNIPGKSNHGVAVKGGITF